MAAVGISLGLGVLTVGCGRPDQEADEQPRPSVTDRPIEVKHRGYVGSAACKSCHENNHENWFASYHRTMTQLATPESVIGEFDGVERVLTGKFWSHHLAEKGLRCRLEQRGDEFWVSMDDLTTKDRSKIPERIDRRVVMTTGSHHMQVYWYASGKSRILGQVPFVYLIEEKRWVPRRAAFLHDPASRVHSEEARWNGQCISCHATGGVPKPTRDYTQNPPRVNGADTRVAEFGISCEACHGPGGDHVAAHTEMPELNQGLHITNPDDLSPRLASQVCGQCHSVHAYDSLQSRLEHVDNGARFRPGDQLEESGVFVMKRAGQERHPTVANMLRADPNTMDNFFWGDGMVRVAGREYNGLLESPCYTHGDPSKMMSCLSCHAPHQEKSDGRPLKEWANDQLKVSAMDNRACTQCHESFKEDAALEAHTFHAAGSSGSSCYNCHMPHTTYGLLKAIRSHTITSPTVRESAVVGRPNACNQCHLDKSLGWTADLLTERYGQERMRLSDTEELVPASLAWSLRGDAGQRALAAWTMGWEEARKVSGAGWIPSALLPLLDDPYDAVRLIAWRALRKEPALASSGYDFLAHSEDRVAAIAKLRELLETSPDFSDASDLIDDPEGKLGEGVLQRLLEARDDRSIMLAE